MSPSTLSLLATLSLLSALASPSASAQERLIPRDVLEDKIRGGWAGQMIGVAYGEPTEFRFKGRRIEGPIAWEPAQVASAIRQDDLYVEMTFAEVLDRLGLDATSRDFGEMFRDTSYDLWHANAAARRLLQNGIEAPRTGQPELNLHANDIDFQIESDFIGLMTPGLPVEANRLAERVGRVMNAGDGLYGGMFVAGMYAAAFFETEPRRVVEIGLESIPRDSGYARAIRDALAWTDETGDWVAVWERLTERWDRDDVCPEGALQDFNIDARLNGAFVALGLLAGGGDFSRTLEIAARAGQDSDCNPSSAAGVLGTMLGYSKIPEGWKSGIPAIAETRFAYTRYSFEEIVDSTVRRAIAAAERAGGRLEGDVLVLPEQDPVAPPLEQFEPGVPTRLIEATDPDWRFTGFETTTLRGKTHRLASAPGAAASVRFRGTGVALWAPMSPRGGMVDVYLDGALATRANAWVDAATHDEVVFHVTGLPEAAHELRVVVADEKDSRSEGHELLVRAAVVYGIR